MKHEVLLKTHPATKGIPTTSYLYVNTEGTMKMILDPKGAHKQALAILESTPLSHGASNGGSDVHYVPAEYVSVVQEILSKQFDAKVGKTQISTHADKDLTGLVLGELDDKKLLLVCNQIADHIIELNTAKSSFHP